MLLPYVVGLDEAIGYCDAYGKMPFLLQVVDNMVSISNLSLN
jgi:hypothetical protein